MEQLGPEACRPERPPLRLDEPEHRLQYGAHVPLEEHVVAKTPPNLLGH